MKVLVGSIISLSLLLLSSSCTSSNSNDATGVKEEEIIAEVDLDKIRERGKLVALFDNSSTSYFIYRGQPMGYEYDLLHRFCEEIGVDLEIKISSNFETAFDLLNSGEIDVVAYYLTITKERKKRIDFTESFVTTRQVLVQRKPDNWKKMSRGNVERNLIRNQVDLIGRSVHVRAASAFQSRLEHLSEEIGGDIHIVQQHDMEQEELIRMVAEGEIEYTVSDADLAMVNAAYYPQLDVETPLSFPQRIAWAVRKTSPQLKTELDTFIKKIKSTSLHQVIYNKYFRVDRNIIERAKSDLSSISGGGISEYDPIIKQWADSIQWDWMLVSSMIYQESRFKADANSWAGARGLMQLMPATGKRFYANDLLNPQQNIRAGTLFLQYLENQWKEVVPDSAQRKKFILASYNVGLGHVQDAHALAEKLGYDPSLWDENVEEAMKLKSDPKYFRDEVVKYGYARGRSVAAYVEEIITRYGQYKSLFIEGENI